MPPVKRLLGMTCLLAFIFFLLPVCVARLLPRNRAEQEETVHAIRSEDDLDDLEDLSNRQQEEALSKLGPEGERLLEAWFWTKIISVDEAREMARRRGYLFPAGAEKSIEEASRWRGVLGLTIRSG